MAQIKKKVSSNADAAKPLGFVKFKGQEHPFYSKKEKNALIQQAGGSYVLISANHLGYTVHCSSVDCAVISRECGKTKDNERNGK